MGLATTPKAGIYGDRASLTSSEDSGAEIRAKILSNQLRDHRFFLTLAILAALMIFWGFSSTYYLKPLQSFGALPRSPELSLLVHAHAALFTLWVLFYVFQTALISKGRRTLHMTLGWASAVLIPAMVILGIITVFYGAKMGHKQVWPDPESAALVNLDPGLMFGILGGAGILLRKKIEAHRRLILSSRRSWHTARW